jgi:hypothetical protein
MNIATSVSRRYELRLPASIWLILLMIFMILGKVLESLKDKPPLQN